MAVHNRTLGASGEDRAVAWYSEQGFTILDRNWRSGRLGEIDVVAYKAGELVVSEVKTRTSDRFGLPTDAITPAKQQRMRRLAAAYRRANQDLYVRTIRFDVVAIIGPQLIVYDHAF